MSVFGQVRLADTMMIDAFGRLKVAISNGQFDFTGQYGDNDLYWEHVSTGTGVVSNLPLEGGVRLSTGGTLASAGTIRQTKQFMRYHPGRSMNIEQTFVMSAAQTNVLVSVGYFYENDGIFFSRNGSTLQITLRSSTSGSPVDNTVVQANWNVDKLNGSGPSGITLDVTKAQILFIQFQYLGVGRAQVGFIIDGLYVVAHQFLSANNLTVPYMAIPSLPIRASVLNTGVAGGVVTLDVFCQTAHTSGLAVKEQQYSISNGIITFATSTTLKPLISIRAGTLLGGTTGGGSFTNRSHIIPVSYHISVGSQNHEFRIVLNPTLTGANFQPVDSHSLADFDTAATAMSGGLVMDSGYISSANATRIAIDPAIELAVPLVFSGLLNIQDILTLAIRSTAAAGTASGAWTWKEPF